MAYETWGQLDPSGGNAVLVCHALTADSHVSGEGGWWGDLIGPGRPVDTDRFFVVCPNVLGGCRGTTGPSSPAPDGRPWGSRFPRITVRDQVAVEHAVADALGIQRWAAVLGGSMGGMRALEWAVMSPYRIGGLLLLATTAAASADQIAWGATQLAAIRADPQWQGGDYHAGGHPDLGLGLARRIAHLTYRSESELAARFDRAAQPGEDPYTGGRFAVESYLDHQADKLVRRFDAGSYVALTEAMAGHDLGRGRGDAKAALAAYVSSGARSTVIAIDTDRLYPPYQQAELADLLGTELAVVRSLRGHDGFLLETGQVGPLAMDLLAP